MQQKPNNTYTSANNLIENSMEQAVLHIAYFMVVSCLTYSWALKIGVSCSSEMLVDFHWATNNISS
jgi:hypothetical protein